MTDEYKHALICVYSLKEVKLFWWTVQKIQYEARETSFWIDVKVVQNDSQLYINHTCSIWLPSGFEGGPLLLKTLKYTRRKKDFSDSNWMWPESLLLSAWLPWNQKVICKLLREGNHALYYPKPSYLPGANEVMDIRKNILCPCSPKLPH